MMECKGSPFRAAELNAFANDVNTGLSRTLADDKTFSLVKVYSEDFLTVVSEKKYSKYSLKYLLCWLDQLTERSK